MHNGNRLALARAVARSDGARLLTQANVAGPRVPLEQAVASRDAYFVTPRPELLVVDVDLPGDPTAAADVLESFEMLMFSAQQAGVPHARVPSGRPGHWHGYLVAGTGRGRGRLERWCQDRGLDVRNRGIRPPGAPHRHGVPVPISDADGVRVLDVLAQDVEVDATVRLAQMLCPLVLPGRVQVAVRYGHQRAGYASPSHARMALAVGVRARGGSVGFVEAVLRDPLSPLGATFRARPADWQRAELARIWGKAGVWVSAGDTRTTRGADAVAVALGGHPWKGASGASDLAVLEEFVRTARRVGSDVVGAALDDLAVGAGISRDTARAAVRRLMSAGWIRIVARETARTTRTYELVVPGTGAELEFAADPSVPERGDFGDLGADLARRTGIGKSSMRVARAIDRGQARTTLELADVLSMSPATVRYHLRKLRGHGLVSGHSAQWLARTARRAIVAVERALGVHGSQERQQCAIAARRALRRCARLAFMQRTGRAPAATRTVLLAGLT